MGMEIDWSPKTDPDLDAPLQQHPFYAQALTSLGCDIRCGIIKQGTDPLGYVQMIRRKLPIFGSVCLIPRGPVWFDGHDAKTADRTVLTDQFLQSLPRPGMGVHLINAEVPQDGPRKTPIMSAQTVAELDLTAPETLRLAAQQSKWRNRLRAAQNSALHVMHRPMPSDPDHWLFKAEDLQRRKQRYTALPADFVVNWAAQNPKQTRLFTATHRGQIVAAMLFLMHGPRATYHIGWSGSEGRRANAHTLLLWKASNWLAARGQTRLELGVIDTENAPGLARFKLGSGAHARALGPTYLHFGHLSAVFSRGFRPHPRPIPG